MASDIISQSVGKMVNTGTASKVFGGLEMLVWVLFGILVIAFLWWFITNMLAYNIKVDVYKMVGKTMFRDSDWARMKYDKYQGIASFKLRKRKVDLATVINKTSSFIPVKSSWFGWREGIMLVQNGDDKEIDSYSVMHPDKFKDYINNGYDIANVGINRISGVSKVDWMLNQKRINELKPVPWYLSPAVTLVVSGFGIISVVIILIFAGRAITDILHQASSANVLTQQALQALVDATNNLKEACVLNTHNITRSTVLPPP